MLFPDLAPFYEAFLELHGARSAGFDLNPIAAADLRAWLEMEAIPRVSWPVYHRRVRALDRAYLAKTREDRERGRKNRGSSQAGDRQPPRPPRRR